MLESFLWDLAFLIALIITTYLLILSIGFCVYAFAKQSTKERYLTPLAIEKLNKIADKVVKLVSRIEKKQVKPNTKPLIYGEKPEVEKIFNSCCTDYFDSMRYLDEESYNYNNYSDYAFSITFKSSAKSICDVVKVIRNKVISMLNERLAHTNTEYEKYVAVTYDVVLDKLHIFLANNKQGLANIANINNPTKEEDEVIDLFTEGYDDYGKV